MRPPCSGAATPEVRFAAVVRALPRGRKRRRAWASAGHAHMLEQMSKERAMVSESKEKASIAPAEAPGLGPLPEWNLADLYPSRESPELKTDLERGATEA